MPLVRLAAGDGARDREFNDNEACSEQEHFDECCSAGNGGELLHVCVRRLELARIFRDFLNLFKLSELR